jgi:hypothetical protein
MYIPSAPIRKPAENTPRPYRRGASTSHVQDREDDQHTDVVPRERAPQFPHLWLLVSRRRDSP